MDKKSGLRTTLALGAQQERLSGSPPAAGT